MRLAIVYPEIKLNVVKNVLSTVNIAFRSKIINRASCETFL